MKGLCRIKTEPTQNRQAKISARENLTWIREKGNILIKKRRGNKDEGEKKRTQNGKKEFLINN